MRDVRILFIAFLFFSASLSGCIGKEVSSKEIDNEEIIIDEFIRPDPDKYECIEFDEWDRCWLTYVPENVNVSSNVPVLFELHGWAASSFEMRNYTGLLEFADEEGIIVVHPEGIALEGSGAFGEGEESWNGGHCCGDAAILDIDDVGFLSLLIEKMIEEYPIDENRVYFTGWSNGCIMSQRMALQASHLIAAIACTSGYLGFLDDSEYSPIPIMEMHGFGDEIAQYSNSARIALFEEDAQNIEAIQSGAHENLYDWANFNGCEGLTPDSNDPSSLYSIQRFTSCENNTEVALFTSYSGGHNLYENDACQFDFVWSCWGNQGAFDTHEIIWEFVSRYSKENIEGNT
jgi:polyhydroxybutyrate depolymerase